MRCIKTPPLPRQSRNARARARAEPPCRAAAMGLSTRTEGRREGARGREGEGRKREARDAMKAGEKAGMEEERERGGWATDPVWPARLLRSLQEVRFHQLVPARKFARIDQIVKSIASTGGDQRTGWESPAAGDNDGWAAAGEKRTQLTHSVWPSSA